MKASEHYKRLVDREEWIQKTGVANIEFSHLLDLFRDEREDIQAMLKELNLARKIMKEFWFCNLVKPFHRLKALLEEYEKL